MERGEIVGLLGPNGAGKSTTLKCLTGMLPYREGTVEVFGVPVKGDAAEAKTKFGFVTDDHAVFSKMTGLEYVAFMADVYGVGRREREERFALLSERFALGGKAGALISSYSHGMKQKICMIGSLIHAPSLWILDRADAGAGSVLHAVGVGIHEKITPRQATRCCSPRTILTPCAGYATA